MEKERDFSKAATTYRQNAIVQKLMAKALCQMCCNFYKNDFNTILEIGSGTGFLSENIVSYFKFKKLILNDITDNFTSLKDVEFLKGDASRIDLPKKCDLIISNACFQWIDDIRKFFLKLKTSLNKDGVLVFSSFGEENYKEFKSIVGFGLNYVDYLIILRECGYEALEFEQEIQTLYFSSPREVLRHIKSTGVALKNSQKWNKERLKTFENEYCNLFGDKNGVALTYHPVYIMARPK